MINNTEQFKRIPCGAIINTNKLAHEQAKVRKNLGLKLKKERDEKDKKINTLESRLSQLESLIYNNNKNT